MVLAKGAEQRSRVRAPARRACWLPYAAPL